jgi:arylsulfatase
MPFGGVIKEAAPDSKPYWPPRVVPPKGAPNILLIMTDDQGYGVSGTFGGVIPTPALDRIAKAGLRYTQFHSTALCSPTRAALITGRNHHSMGFGVISELSTGYPGYDSVMSLEKASIGEILKENGYATSWFGKNHNTPAFQLSASGPYDQWPSGMGFEYFYGFMGGETDQWTPFLFRDHTQIFPWIGKPGYNLTTDLADEAIKHMRDLNAAAPDQPFFVYYVPGGTHSPHQPKPEWIAKFKGKFDMGYEKLRDVIFANQKKLGVIPETTQLTPLPPELPKWDSLSLLHKKLYAREAEVFAGYAAYTDNEIGRVIQAVEDMGKLDNTLIIYISGDNGASAEGMLNGTPNEFTTFNGVAVPVKDQFLWYEFWGSERTFPHMAAAWAWAFDTPFKWCKQVASHFGGTRQGMCISWPGHIKDVGGIRDQFHHVIDVVPTILEATGISAPDMIDGIKQRPIEGVSMAYTWDSAAAGPNAPTRHTTQYFEMLGNRAIYHDDWLAATTPVTIPWELSAKPPPDVITGYKWELYNIKDDFSEFNDLAATMPDKLKEMQNLFDAEAKKYNVLPLDNSTLARFITPRPSATAGRTSFTFSGELTGVPASAAPNILQKSYKITAEVEIPKGGAEGMIVTEGGRFGGYGLFLSKGELGIGRGKPVFLYNLLDLKRTAWEGPELKAGKHTIVFDFKFDGGGLGKGGTGTLFVDAKEVDKKSMKSTTPIMFPEDEDFDVGQDTRTPVALVEYRYECPFKFTGKIDKLTFDLGEPQYSEGDRKQLPAIADRVARAKD